MTAAARPYTLVAELTYRCPLRCLYCSNPTEQRKPYTELDTVTWTRVFAEASRLGVVQLHLSGGEPLLRRDLEQLIGVAREQQLYVNLISSGVPLERERLTRLRDAGLDALQLSVQGTDAQTNTWVAGRDFLEQKLRVAEWAQALGLPLTLNVVLHRGNLDAIESFIALGEQLGADRIELANTQYLGFALRNRAALLPSEAQLDRARAVAAGARQRLLGKMEVLFVMPDYFRDRPRPCMGGWGSSFVLVNPVGDVLPCHQATSISGLTFENVADAPLERIWHDSPAFRAFRGEQWMPEPCQSCERRALDFGGCRCQAFQLLGDAALTDPACARSPHHGVVRAARQQAQQPTRPQLGSEQPLRYRSLPLLVD